MFKEETLTDEQIISNVMSGDTNSFRIIVNKYQKNIFSIGMRFFKNEDDSYDFTQEVFIKVYSKLNTYKGWAPFKFWLTKIAYNHGINRIKTIKDETVINDQLLQSDCKTPDAIHEKNELKQVLLDAIDKLKGQYKVCLDLYFFMGLTYTQISDITQIPVNTIKSNVFRAKQTLRNSLRGTIAEDYNEM